LVNCVNGSIEWTRNWEVNTYKSVGLVTRLQIMTLKSMASIHWLEEEVCFKSRAEKGKAD